MAGPDGRSTSRSAERSTQGQTLDAQSRCPSRTSRGLPPGAMSTRRTTTPIMRLVANRKGSSQPRIIMVQYTISVDIVTATASLEELLRRAHQRSIHGIQLCGQLVPLAVVPTIRPAIAQPRPRSLLNSIQPLWL